MKVIGSPAHGKLRETDRPTRVSSWINFDPKPEVNQSLTKLILTMPSKAKPEPRPAAAAANKTHVAPNSQDEFPADWFVEGLKPEKLDAIIADDEKLRARWNGDTKGLNDTSGSAMDLSIAIMLAAKGFSGNEIFRSLRAFAHGSKNGAAQDQKRHYGRIIQMALSGPRRVGLDDLENLKVLGVNEDNKVAIYALDKHRLHEIDLGNLKMTDLVLLGGAGIAKLVGDRKTVKIGEQEMQTISLNDLKIEIADCARNTMLGTLEEAGSGVWEQDDDVLVVGNQIIKVTKTGSIETIEIPVIGPYYFKRGGGHMLPVSAVGERLRTWDASTGS